MIRFEIDAKGLRFEIQWQLFIDTLRGIGRLLQGMLTLLKKLQPLITAIGAVIAAIAALHAVPAVRWLLQLLGWP